MPWAVWPLKFRLNDLEANKAALQKVREDKIREANDGHDGTWVAHPGLVQIAKEEFDSWILRIREILQQPESPITLTNETWAITERIELWQALGPRIFDENLDRFKQSAVTVLTEHDPKFELPPEERYAIASSEAYSHWFQSGLVRGINVLESSVGIVS